jgi:2'-5' RNA ligase
MGRVRDEAGPNERRRLGKLLADTTFTALHNIDVDAVNLMKSQLTLGGAIYSCIGSVKLK